MSPIGTPQLPAAPPQRIVVVPGSAERRRWSRRRRAPAALWLLLLALLLTASEPRAQVVFGSQVNSGSGPVTALFEARNGVVTQIPTGLPNNEFAALSPDGRLITVSSPDPQQPQEASWDLFAFDRASGQRWRLVDNVTQAQPDGSFNSASPLFSAVETTNQRVAFVNQLSSSNNQQQGGSVRVLQVIRASDGFLLSTAEIGNGNAIDFYQSEFVGLSWRRDAPAFAAPAYVDVVSNMGRPTVNAALVLFAQQGVAGEFVRVAQLTAPRVFDQPGQIIAETDAWPAFSPDGQRLAWFRITYPNPLMTQPASMQLMLGPAGGTATPTLLVQFNPGFLPLGLAWSADSSTLVFSLANQSASGGQFPPTAEPSTAILRTFNLQSGTIGTVAGAPVGYFPNVAPPSPSIFASGFE